MLREEMYRANITRASSGEKDNSPIIEKVLSLKQEKAKLLGYANFAEVSMASKVSANLHLSHWTNLNFMRKSRLLPRVATSCLPRCSFFSNNVLVQRIDVCVA